MASEGDLLPSNSTAWERNTSLVMDPWPKLDVPATDIRGVKLRPPQPASFRPFIIWEYGLGRVSRFFASELDCIAHGVPWARVRGTQDAITQALDWVGYDGEVENFPPRRRRWHLFMLEMDRFRDAEEPDLNNIEFLAQESVAQRSRFWRGFKAYDVRALEFSRTRWGQARYSTYSGARIKADGAKWSFGRTYERDYTPSQADLEALDVWLAPDATGLGWGSFTWQAPGVTWTSSPAATRSRLMAAGVLAQSCWIRFRAAGGAIIGHRRARVYRGVLADAAGSYSVGAARFNPTAGASIIYVEGLTDFGDGYGSTAATWSLLFDPVIVAPAKPGIQWAGPSQLSGGVEIMSTSATVQFGRTVRERFKACLRF